MYNVLFHPRTWNKFPFMQNIFYLHCFKVFLQCIFFIRLILYIIQILLNFIFLFKITSLEGKDLKFLDPVTEFFSWILASIHVMLYLGFILGLEDYILLLSFSCCNSLPSLPLISGHVTKDVPVRLFLSYLFTFFFFW